MTDVDDTLAFSALLRLDFGFFLRIAFRELGGMSEYRHNWHIDAIIHQLDLICDGSNKKLMVTMPPRHLKSRIVSIAWLAWMMGHNPALSFLCVSYGQTLSEDHARDCLQIMESRWYRPAFPRLVLTRRALEELRTSEGGKRIATSVDGPITGLGADIIIIDDPMKAQDAMSQKAREKAINWFDDTLSQRLTNQLTGAVIVVMQRLHEGDLVGELQRREGWRELCLPAIATKDEVVSLTRGRTYHRREGCALHLERQPLSLLLERKAANPYVFAGQYQQQPVPAVGNIIEAAWLQKYDLSSLDLDQGQIVMSLDTASKDNPFNDYSAFVIARVLGKSIHVINVYRARLKFPALKEKTIELSRLHGAQVLLIEDAASGEQLIQSLEANDLDGVPSPIAIRPEGDKISRVMGVSAMIQAGRLFLPNQAHWLSDYISELLGFPSTRYDDQVDATAQLLAWVQKKDQFRPTMNAGPELIVPGESSRDRPTPEFKGDPWGA